MRGHALERRFGREVEDVGETVAAHRADAVVFRSGVDAAAGLDGVDLLLETPGLSPDDGQETASVESFGNLSAGDVHQCRGHVDVFAHGVGRRAGFDHARPAHDEARLQAFVIAGPLAERERITLLAGEDEDGVFVESVFAEQGVHRAHLIVQYVDLREIIAELPARFGRVDEVAGQREVVGVPEAAVAERPRVVRLGRADVEEERFARLCHVGQERFDLFGVYAAQRLLRKELEREGFDRRDVPLALQGDAVTGLLEVFGQRVHALVEPRVVGIGSRADGIKPREQAVARRGTHGRRLEEALETQSLRGQPVDVGRDGVGASVAAQVVMAAVVGDDEHDVGAFRALPGGFGGLGRAAGEQGQRGPESDLSGGYRLVSHGCPVRRSVIVSRRRCGGGAPTRPVRSSKGRGPARDSPPRGSSFR